MLKPCGKVIFGSAEILTLLSASENEIVENLRKGDPEAFDAIYGMYAGKLYAFGMKYLRSASDAEELVQSVFIRVWENHDKLDSSLSFRSYLFTIAYNDICKLFRRKSYLNKYVSETLNENKEWSLNAEEGTEYRSVIEEVGRLIDTLPEKQKEAFIKSKLEGKTTRDIATDLGLSPGTVDNYISLTVKYIRSKMGKGNLPVMLLLALFATLS